jgi:hypothetical protein
MPDVLALGLDATQQPWVRTPDLRALGQAGM